MRIEEAMVRSNDLLAGARAGQQGVCQLPFRWRGAKRRANVSSSADRTPQG